MNLLSENGIWITESEFVAADGKISKATGETQIHIDNRIISNHSFAEIDGKKLINDYEITISDTNRHPFQSKNPALGVQKGYFDIDRNTVYSRFEIDSTTMNGFEVIIREGNICTAYGALYDHTNLINTWKAKLRKKS
jgi:hypothetical protein